MTNEREELALKLERMGITNWEDKILKQAAQLLREDGKIIEAAGTQYEMWKDCRKENTELQSELEEARNMLQEFLDAHREKSTTGLPEARSKRCNIVVTHAWLEHVRQSLTPQEDSSVCKECGDTDRKLTLKDGVRSSGPCPNGCQPTKDKDCACGGEIVPWRDNDLNQIGERCKKCHTKWRGGRQPPKPKEGE